MPAYVSIRQRMPAYVSIRLWLVGRLAGTAGCLHTSAYVSIRQRMPAYVSIRQHTPEAEVGDIGSDAGFYVAFLLLKQRCLLLLPRLLHHTAGVSVFVLFVLVKQVN